MEGIASADLIGCLQKPVFRHHAAGLAFQVTGWQVA